MLKLFKGLKPYWTLVIGVLVLVFYFDYDGPRVTRFNVRYC